MTTGYTSLLGLALPVTGELPGTWGDTVNNYITQYLDAAVAGAQVISGSQTAVTLSTTTGLSLAQVGGSGGTGSAQYAMIRCTGNPAGMLTITAPATNKVYLVLNATSTNQAVKVVGAGPTTGVTINAGQAALIAWNGSDFRTVATTDIAQFTGVLSVASGGTGQSSYTDGQILIGSTAGNTLVKNTLTAGSGITITNGSGSIQISASGGGGTVTSVTASSPLASSGGATPNISFTGTLPVANGGTGQTSYTDGQLLIGNTTGNTLNKATLTAGSGISITNGAGSITIAATGGGGGITAVTASAPLSSSGGATPDISFTGTLAVANGGTGQTTYTNGQLLIGNTTGGTLNKATLTQGTGITITNGAGSITVTNAGVTSISGTTNQVTASASTGGVTLSLPQNINTGSNVQFGSFGVGTAASGTAGEIRATNNITAYYSSDRKFKENIRDIPNALSAVNAIGGKLFDWTDEYIKNNGGEDGYFVRKSDFGVIAQDVEQVFPQAVRKREDGSLAVDYEKLAALAFAAIRELSARIAALEAK